MAGDVRDMSHNRGRATRSGGPIVALVAFMLGCSPAGELPTADAGPESLAFEEIQLGEFAEIGPFTPVRLYEDGRVLASKREFGPVAVWQDGVWGPDLSKPPFCPSDDCHVGYFEDDTHYGIVVHPYDPQHESRVQHGASTFRGVSALGGDIFPKGVTSSGTVLGEGALTGASGAVYGGVLFFEWAQVEGTPASIIADDNRGHGKYDNRHTIYQISPVPGGGDLVRTWGTDGASGLGDVSGVPNELYHLKDGNLRHLVSMTNAPIDPTKPTIRDGDSHGHLLGFIDGLPKIVALDGTIVDELSNLDATVSDREPMIMNDNHDVIFRRIYESQPTLRTSDGKLKVLTNPVLREPMAYRPGLFNTKRQLLVFANAGALTLLTPTETATVEPELTLSDAVGILATNGPFRANKVTVSVPANSLDLQFLFSPPSGLGQLLVVSIVSPEPMAAGQVFTVGSKVSAGGLLTTSTSYSEFRISGTPPVSTPQLQVGGLIGAGSITIEKLVGTHVTLKLSQLKFSGRSGVSSLTLDGTLVLHNAAR